MASATPNYGFIKPDTGDQGWGDTVNSDLDAIDVAIHTVAVTAGSATPDATGSVKGKLKLAGDLGGTADVPTVPGLAGKAATSHTHVESDVTNLTADLAAKEVSANKGAASGYASLDSGTKVPTAQLGSGSATSSTFLRGDQSWQTVSSGISIDGAGTGAVAAAHSSDTVTASSTQAIAIGKNASANTGAEAIAIGGGVSATAAPQATAQGGIAIGASDASGVAGARAAAPGSVAIGSGDGSTAGAAANGSYSAAYGFNALAGTSYSVAIGAVTNSAQSYNVAIGSYAEAITSTEAVAIGGGQNATASARASAQGAIAIGSSDGASIVGARASGANSVAIGAGDASVNGASATAADSLAIGRTSVVNGTGSVAIGSFAATGSQTYSVSIGANAGVSSGQGLSLGGGSTTTMAPLASAAGAIALGGGGAAGVAGAKASAANAIAIGTGDGSNAGASATAADATAIGRLAVAGNATAVALGAGATTTKANQIMLGTSAEDTVAAGTLSARTPYRVIQIVDDFIGQNTANGDVGQMGWRTGGTGSSTSVNPGEANHPGIQVLSTGATSGFTRFLSTGDSSNQSFIATDVDRFFGILRIVTVTSVTVYFGLLQDSQTTPPGSAGVYFVFDPAVNSHWQTVTRNASTSTTNTTGTTVVANNWYQFEGRRNGSNWEMYVNGALAFTHSTNLPTVAVSPAFFIITNTTSNRDLHCDFFALTTSVLGQRWT